MQVKLTNAKINATVVEVPGALETMKLMGWEEATEDGAAVLLLPKGKNITMAQVRRRCIAKGWAAFLAWLCCTASKATTPSCRTPSAIRCSCGATRQPVVLWFPRWSNAFLKRMH